MNTVTLPAHFGGRQIVLEEPYLLEPNTRLTVIIVPEPIIDQERAEWAGLGRHTLADAYGDNEPEYTAADIKKWNPLYRGPKIETSKKGKLC
jgi:hypothetical protein